MRLISKLNPAPSSKNPIFQNKVHPTRVKTKYEIPHSQVHPLSPGSCWHFGEGGQDKPCLRAEMFEHQYFIAKTNYIAVYKSHRAVCSFIEVVQNTYGTASQSQGGQARSRGNTQGCWCPGKGILGQGGGRRLPLLQGAASSHHVHHGQRGWKSSVPATHTQAASSPATPAPSPSPWSVIPVLEPGKAPQPPGNSEDGTWKRSAGTKHLKNRWRQEQQKVPLWLVFLQ